MMRRAVSTLMHNTTTTTARTSSLSATQQQRHSIFQYAAQQSRLVCAHASGVRHFATEAEKGQTNTDATKTAPDGANPSATAAADEASAALAKVKAELDEMKKQLQYTMADRENVRRILMRDVKEARETGLREFAKDLLDVSDNFERALEAAKADADRLPEVKLLFDGVAMTEAQLHKVFERFGIKRFKPLGDKFDPSQHSALLEMDSPDFADGHVGVVIKNGFTLKDRVLRPADVGVIRKPKSQ